MRVLLIAIMIFVNCYGFKNYLISDKDFTNVSMFSKEAYIKAFSKYIGTNRVKQVYYAGRYYGINPLILFTKLQCESGLLSKWPKRDINDYAFCCAVHIEEQGTNWHTFNWQAWQCSYWLKKHYKQAKAYKYKAFIYDNNRVEKLKNSATYSLYKYTPHYMLSGKAYNKSYKLGNFVLPQVYKKLKNNLIITQN